MFKKIIYSCMALSLTLMPSSEVMAEVTGGTITNEATSITVHSTNKWTSGKITNSGGTLTINGDNAYIPPSSQDSSNVPNYVQTNGTLSITNGGKLTLMGYTNSPEVYATISGGSVTLDGSSALTIGSASNITDAVNVSIGSGSTINLTASVSNQTPSLVLSGSDTWTGTIRTSGDGILSLQNFDNSGDTSSVYQQIGGRLDVGSTTSLSSYSIDNTDSYLSDGAVYIYDGSDMSIYSTTDLSVDEGAAYDSALGTTVTLGEGVNLNINEGGALYLYGNGSAVINDTDGYDDEWNGEVFLGDGVTEGENPVLTLRNVKKDFSSDDTTDFLYMSGGTLNIHANENGASSIVGVNGYTVDDGSGTEVNMSNYVGTVNIQGNDSENSSLTLNYQYPDSYTNGIGYTTEKTQVNLQGNADYIINTTATATDGTTAVPMFVISNNAPTGTGSNNTVTVKGIGGYGVRPRDGSDTVDIGANVNVESGTMQVSAKNLKIGIDNETGVTPYGDLTVGKAGNTDTAYFTSDAATNIIVGNMALNNAWYTVNNPSVTSVGGSLYSGAGSGINMMNGGMDNINVAGATTVDNLQLKIDVDPAKYGTFLQANDQINSSLVVANPNSVLNLTDYNLLSNNLTKNKYTFRVVNAAGEKYSIAPNAAKVVTGNATRVIHSSVGDYTMVPSDVKGAFDLALFQFNPQALRALVAPNIIYANQQAINNQLFDRMIYSNLPYFNGRCTNKTASADTLYSPYQYTTEDTGLWFKPYANFETIHMNYGLRRVRNNAYGAMIGADFGRKDFGNWSFIPSAFIGYNGGRTTFNGVGMWHNGGQGGLMGTLTNRNFITSMAVYAGGYHNSMDVWGKHDHNAMWNAGVASKTAYNIHLPWDFILQPTLYMAYNYVGASSFTSHLDGLKYKVDPYNAYSVAPGVTLIWQKETFSIYALFQAMFNIGSTVSGRIAEIDLPHVGIKDPYFEYGVGASKYFLDRFSGYGQVVARSGSRKGVGFQLGLNVKL